jgi:uncharacterized membrane protein (UPF0127 family)
VNWKRIVPALALAAVLLPGCDNPPAPSSVPESKPQVWEPTEAQPRLPAIKLWVGPAEISAEVAGTDRQIQTGMMFRTNVVDTNGMVFVFQRPHQAAFWMKNCPVPLSCAYIDPDGVILELHGLEPHNTNSIVASSDQVMFVLETARGWFERNGVHTNMVVRSERGTLLQTFFGGRNR